MPLGLRTLTRADATAIGAWRYAPPYDTYDVPPADARLLTDDPRDHPPRGSKDWTPLCLADRRGVRDVVPPLPAGAYTLRFIPDGQWTGPSVRPTSVILIGTTD